MNDQTVASVDNYIDELFNEKDPVLDEVVASIEKNGIPAISVSANQGKFLQMLVQLCKAKNVLEVGTLAGYSTIWMARALPPGGKLITLELDPKHAAVAQANIDRAGLTDRVEIMIGKAIDLLAQLKEKALAPFDFIFIDADKPPYTEYFQLSLQLSRPGTLIVADNVIRDGKVLDPETKDESAQGARRFNYSLSLNKSVDATIVQMVGVKEYDGMALAIVK